MCPERSQTCTEKRNRHKCGRVCPEEVGAREMFAFFILFYVSFYFLNNGHELFIQSEGENFCSVLRVWRGLGLRDAGRASWGGASPTRKPPRVPHTQVTETEVPSEDVPSGDCRVTVSLPGPAHAFGFCSKDLGSEA